jgi:hypothetical protein
MSLLRRRRVDSEADRISVRELVVHGLGRRPLACGVFWPDTQVTVCRKHIEDESTRRMLDAVRPATDIAKVLVGDDLARRILRLCALSHDHHDR